MREGIITAAIEHGTQDVGAGHEGSHGSGLMHSAILTPGVAVAESRPAAPPPFRNSPSQSLREAAC
jgi:hypothetical protein